MMRENVKQTRIENLDKHIAILQCEIADAKEVRSNLTKEVTFEETLAGVIETEEQEAETKINQIIKKLSKSTGKDYASYSIMHTFGPVTDCSPMDPEPITKYPGKLLTEAQFNINRYSRQQDAVNGLVDFCKKHSWKNEAVMKNWIVKKVIEA